MISHPYIDPTHIERLRELARQEKPVAEMVDYLRSSISPKSFTLVMLKYFILSFNLSLRDARKIEGAHGMGNKAISDDDLDSLLRPLILTGLKAPGGES
jgi:hypothetical protein